MARQVRFSCLICHERRCDLDDLIIHHLGRTPIPFIYGYPRRGQDEIEFRALVIIGIDQLIGGRILVASEPVTIDLIELPQLVILRCI